MQVRDKLIVDLLQKYSAHVEFVGVDLQSATQAGCFDDTLLHLAAFSGDTKDVALLLAHGADIDAIGDIGNTPLHFAVLGGQSYAAKALIDKGANLFLENEFGETAGELAQILGDAEMTLLFETSGISGDEQSKGSQLPESVDADRALARKRWEEFREIQLLNFPS